jgi:hypothetical protein
MWKEVKHNHLDVVLRMVVEDGLGPEVDGTNLYAFEMQEEVHTSG